MKSIIRFSKFFLPAAIISLLLCIAGVVGYFYQGFNLGVDFKAGLIQEIQFAPSALTLTFNGTGTASVTMSRSGLTVVVAGVGIDEVETSFPFASYGTVGELVSGLSSVPGLSARASAPSDTRSSWLVLSAQGSPTLSAEPFAIHYIPPDAKEISIDQVRESLLSLGSVSVQVLGDAAERRFMVRIDDDDLNSDAGVPAEKIVAALEQAFGKSEVAVTSSNYVGSRFSKQLTDQAGILLAATLLLILIYSSIRFHPQYAVGAVLAILHDGLIMVAFVVWSRMEFNTTTIAAILTILGYSINDTIVLFDRMRENFKLLAKEEFAAVINKSINVVLVRTIITSITVFFVVLTLFFLGGEAIHTFAYVMLIGTVLGAYSSVFLCAPLVYEWEVRKRNRLKAARQQLTKKK